MKDDKGCEQVKGDSGCDHDLRRSAWMSSKRKGVSEVDPNGFSKKEYIELQKLRLETEDFKAFRKQVHREWAEHIAFATASMEERMKYWGDSGASIGAASREDTRLEVESLSCSESDSFSARDFEVESLSCSESDSLSAYQTFLCGLDRAALAAVSPKHEAIANEMSDVFVFR